MDTDTITAKCDKCGLKVCDDAVEDRACPNCAATLRYLGPVEPAPTGPEGLTDTEREADWQALSEEDQLGVLLYLEAIAENDEPPF